MPNITVNNNTGTVNVIPGSSLNIVFSGFGGFYGGAMKYLYDMNRATPLLVWSGDADTISLSAGNANVTMLLRAFDYCMGSDASGCYYPSNDIMVVVGAGSSTVNIDCPSGDRYIRGLFENCALGYTLESSLLQNECVCNSAIEAGRQKTAAPTNYVNLAIGAMVIGGLIYILTRKR